MKRLMPITLLVVVGLVLLAGCGLPALGDNGIIPDTGAQSAQDYPAPADVTATPEPTEPYDDSEDLEISATPQPPGGGPTPTVTLALFLPPVGLSPTVEEASPTVDLSPTPTATELIEASPTASETPSPQPTGTTPATADPNPTATAPGPARDSLLGREQFFSELAASQVRNLSDGEIGALNGMVFDSLTGAPQYAVIAPKWLLGLNRGSVPVPWGALNLAGQGIYQPQAGILLLPVPEHVLVTGPTLDRRQWDGHNPTAEWDTGIDDYWVNFVPILPVSGARNTGGTLDDGSAQAVQSAPLVQGTPLLVDEGMLNGLSIDVTDSEGDTLGRVKDLVLDANGNALYAVVHVDDFFGLGGRLAPVPWERLVWSPGGWFILRGNPGALLAAPGYPTRSAFPNFNEADWDRELRGYWGQ